jgi:hypothetical protein
MALTPLKLAPVKSPLLTVSVITIGSPCAPASTSGIGLLKSHVRPPSVRLIIPILLLDGLLTTSVSVALVPELTPVKLTDRSCSVDDFATVDDFAAAPTRPKTHTATAAATAMIIIIMTMTTTVGI